jgi:class 3 adenylate cyclase
MTARLGDHAAREVTRKHNAIVREQVRAHGGREVELLGDGFLLAFADASRAVACAVAMQRAFRAYSEAHPEEPIHIRIGAHTGPVLRDADKFFGLTVILAARIAAQAEAGEILVSAPLSDRLEGSGGFRLGERRDAMLKGIASAQRLTQIVWA